MSKSAVARDDGYQERLNKLRVMQSPDKEELSLDIFEEEEGENFDDESNSSLNPSIIRDINEDLDDAEAL